MYADKMLETGREVIVSEIKRYIRDSIEKVIRGGIDVNH